MRKLVFLFFVINVALCFAGETVYVYDSGGARTPYELAKVDSVSFAEPNALSVYPTEKNMASTGGRFSVDIYTAKPWTAIVSDPTAIILSKSSGKGGDAESINVSAFPNSDSRPYFETVTFKSDDGTTAVLKVNVSVDNEYLNLYTVDEKGWWISFDSYKEMPRAGGEFDVQVSSNTYWESYSYDNGVHLSQSSGKYSGTIKVTVDPNTDAYTSYRSIYFNTMGGTSKSGNIKQDGEKITVGPYSKKVPPLGDTYKIGIESNSDWSVSSDKDWVMFEQIDGTLTDSIDVFVGKGYEDAESATITVATKNGIKATCKVSHEADVVSVGPESKTIAPLGGTYKIGISSNTDWTVSASESWVTFNKTKGTLNDSILVTVGKADKDAASATITVATTNGKTATCTVTHEVEQISVSPTTQIIAFEGGSVDVAVASNTDWTVSSSKSWATMSQTKGTGNALVVLYVSSIDKSKADTATVTYTTSIGKSAILKIYRPSYTGVGENVLDINGRSYKTVWINGQNWMAENLKCDKYDTESEAYNAKWLTNNTIPTSNDAVYTPYYTDASDKSKWTTTEYSGNLTDAQVDKLGYLYNWAAAVGVENGYDYGTSPFTGNRQGICPNGWHMPTKAEWDALITYIEVTQSKGSNTAGKHLKTTSGWYSGDSSYKPGLDTYGFAALPAGYVEEEVVVYFVGEFAMFWAATPYEGGSYYANNFGTAYGYDYLFDGVIQKYYELSVRCLRD